MPSTPHKRPQETPPPAPIHPLKMAIEDFLARLRGLHRYYPAIIAHVDETAEEARDSYSEVFRQSKKASQEPLNLVDESASGLHAMPLSKHTKFVLATRRRSDARTAMRAIPRASLLGFVSYYDTFLSDLIKALYSTRSELQKHITREVSFAELLNVQDIDELRAIVIEKEIETVLRDNRLEQIGWFKKRFKVPVEQVAVIDDFLELSERRNLIAHNGGKATNRYLMATGQSGIAIGEDLGVDGTYLEHAYRVLFEMGVALGQLSWRQVRPDQLDLADDALSGVGYEMLVLEEFELAIKIFGFAVGLETYSSQHHRFRFVVNLAQSHKWLGDDDQCAEILDSNDWSAAGVPFHLALAILRDDWARAETLMEQVGKSGELPRAAFTDWPLFKTFRDTKEFQRAFQEIYGDA